MHGCYPVRRSYIAVDTTSDTNNESRPLLTISGKDSNGKMLTVLCAFLPNDQLWVFRWVFRWVLNVVLSQMFDVTILRKVNMIISDGGSQKYGQSNNTIKEFIPHVYRARCG